MKKKMTLLLSFMLLFSMSACSNNPEPDNSKEPNSPEKETISFEEITVVDNEDCVIKITSIEPDNMWGYTLNAYLENKSEDKTYMFSIESAAVNGVQSDPLFATEVAASKKSKEKISFIDSDLEDYGIGEITDIQLTFKVYDSDDWESDDVAYETVHVYPFGKDKATKFERKNQDSDNVIVANDKVIVIITGYEEDDIWGYSMNLYLVNKTGKELMFSVDNVSVNGFMADPFWATSIIPDKSSFTSMSWSTTTLEENDITKVEEIEMQLRIYDNEDWSKDDIFNETIILKP